MWKTTCHVVSAWYFTLPSLASWAGVTKTTRAHWHTCKPAPQLQWQKLLWQKQTHLSEFSRNGSMIFAISVIQVVATLPDRTNNSLALLLKCSLLPLAPTLGYTVNEISVGLHVSINFQFLFILCRFFFRNRESDACHAQWKLIETCRPTDISFTVNKSTWQVLFRFCSDERIISTLHRWVFTCIVYVI